VARELSEDNKRMLFLPVGFAHGYTVLSELAEVQYKCTTLYDPAEDVGICWNDPDLAVAWPVDEPILSARDRSNPSLREVFPDVFDTR
jgi:dTDP-4-dehydrorhamnose 3,5-epimerase